jgi:hypothetical protein
MTHMVTRLHEISLSIPCKDKEHEEAATEAVKACLRQMYTVAVMLAHNGAMPRLQLVYTSSTSGKNVVDITDAPEPEPELVIED